MKKSYGKYTYKNASIKNGCSKMIGPSNGFSYKIYFIRKCFKLSSDAFHKLSVALN